MESLQDQIKQLEKDHSIAQEKILAMEEQSRALQESGSKTAMSLKATHLAVEECQKAMAISELCLMDHEDRLSREALNAFISRSGTGRSPYGKKRRSSVMARPEVFFDKDYKSVEIGMKMEKRWEFVQDRVQLLRDRVSNLSEEFKQQTELVRGEFAGFEKMFGVVTQLLLKQMNNPLTILPHQRNAIHAKAAAATTSAQSDGALDDEEDAHLVKKSVNRISAGAKMVGKLGGAFGKKVKGRDGVRSSIDLVNSSSCCCCRMS